jgi:hypothetical protein
MGVYKRGKVWWYRFTWRAEAIRESTKQPNKRVAEQIEAAHKTSLAKGEVGIRDRKAAATIRQFAKTDFLPFCRSTFAAKTKTLGYYENGAARLLEFSPVADESLDTITGEKIAGYARRRQDMGMTVSTVNRELQVLRRMFALAVEWGKVERVLPRVRMIPGEAHRERVINVNEEKFYLEAAQGSASRRLKRTNELWSESGRPSAVSSQSSLPTHLGSATLRRFSWIVASGRKNAFASAGSSVRTTPSRSPTARPTMPAAAFLFLSAYSQFWQCAARTRKDRGSSPRPTRAATSSRGVFAANMPKRARQRRWSISRSTPSDTRA